MKRRASFLLVALIGALIGDAGLAVELDQHGQPHPWRGRDVERYTVLDFAASWCAPCMTSLPRLQTLSERAPALRFLVVSVDDEVAGRDLLVERLDLELPVLWDGDYAIANHYEPEAMPATYILAPGGEIVYQHTGSDGDDWRELVRRVEQLQSELSTSHAQAAKTDR